MIWLTADTHFNHSNCIDFCRRPFSDVTVMNDTLIDNWNRLVKHGDTVYHLGDFAFAKGEAGRKEVSKIRSKLNGKIHLIYGNHCVSNKLLKLSHIFSSCVPMMELKYNGLFFVLCHYQMTVWNRSHYNSFQLYGHSHGMSKPVGKQMDVGVDTNGYKPYSIDEIIEIMRTKENNRNYIEDRRRGGH